MRIRQWLKQKARSAFGAQEILAAMARDAAVEGKMSQLYARLLDAATDEAAPGFRKDQVPCLIDVNGDLIWLPGNLLPFIWHTHAGSSSLVPQFIIETPHYVWIRDRLRPGDAALDCGSNIGLFSVMMAERVGPTGWVHAFEPSPGSCRDLGRVLSLNGLHNVMVNECALADAAGEAEFYDVQVANVYRESSHLALVKSAAPDVALPHLKRTVKTTTLDAYMAKTGVKPRLIKIDVEGAEFNVLAGGRELIRSVKPLLVIEFHPDETGRFDHPRLEAFLKSYNYQYTADYKTYYCE